MIIKNKELTFLFNRQNEILTNKNKRNGKIVYS